MEPTLDAMLYLGNGTIGPIPMNTEQSSALLIAWRKGAELSVDMGTEGTVYINLSTVVAIKAVWRKEGVPSEPDFVNEARKRAGLYCDNPECEWYGTYGLSQDHQHTYAHQPNDAAL